MGSLSDLDHDRDFVSHDLVLRNQWYNFRVGRHRRRRFSVISEDNDSQPVCGSRSIPRWESREREDVDGRRRVETGSVILKLADDTVSSDLRWVNSKVIGPTPSRCTDTACTWRSTESRRAKLSLSPSRGCLSK